MIELRRLQRMEAARSEFSLERIKDRPDGQYEYVAKAQLYNRPNDRVMVFQKGCFANTIRLNVRSGKVTIKNGHCGSSADGSIGTMVEAWETDEALLYKGLLSSTAADVATKLREGHVRENSIEMIPISEDRTMVSLGDVPVGAYIYDQPTRDGKIEAIMWTEVALQGIALLSDSSQGVDAIIGLGSAITAPSGVNLSSAAWDPGGASERLAEWAQTEPKWSADRRPNYARLAAGHVYRCHDKSGSIVLLGQVADVVGGRLTVFKDAYDAAYDQIREADIREADRASALSALWEHARGTSATPLASTMTTELPSEETTAVGLAGPDAEPPTNDDSPTIRLQARIDALELKLMGLELRVATGQAKETSHVTAVAGTGPAGTKQPDPGGGGP
jgi:hypothetical protein